MHLQKPVFTYSTCDSFTKSKERIKKIKETGDSRQIYQNKLDKACFQHDVAYGDFKDLNRKTYADKVLHYKGFNIAKNLKYDGYQRRLTSMVYKCFDKNFSSSGIINANISTRQLDEELYKSFIRKFNRRKVHPPFVDNIWGVDLGNMQLLGKFNEWFRFLVCVIEI